MIRGPTAVEWFEYHSSMEAAGFNIDVHKTECLLRFCQHDGVLRRLPCRVFFVSGGGLQRPVYGVGWGCIHPGTTIRPQTTKTSPAHLYAVAGASGNSKLDTQSRSRARCIGWARGPRVSRGTPLAGHCLSTSGDPLATVG